MTSLTPSRDKQSEVLNHCKCIIDYLDNYQSEGGEDLNVQMGVGVHMPFCS